MPLGAELTAAVPLVGGEPQVIHKQGEGGQGEMLGQHDADPQGRRA